jgi:hypothetical protein
LIIIKTSSTEISLPIDEERLNAGINVKAISQRISHNALAEILMGN